MELQVKATQEVNKILQTLMHNIKDLNEGDEIGAWLLGDWTQKEETLTLLLDNVIIPKQDVSKAEVDISPASMIDTIKEIGQDQCNRIKAHWHIHPFGKGRTNWSSIDESKISDFMEPEKGREIFVFLLSSEDQIKARVEINATTTILGIKTTIKRSIDDLEVSIQGQEDETLIKQIKARIEEKVTKSRDKWTKWNKSDYDWRKYDRYESQQTTLAETVQDNYQVRRKKTRVTVYLDPTFAYFVEHSGIFETTITQRPTTRVESSKTVMEFRTETKREAEELEEELEAELSQAQDMWEEDMKDYNISEVDYLQ